MSYQQETGHGRRARWCAWLANAALLDVFTGRISRSGKLPVLNLPIGSNLNNYGNVSDCGTSTENTLEKSTYNLSISHLSNDL